jgi:MFS family permease
VLGTILCWSRLAGLGAGYCCDEIRTVEDYVRAGPWAILAGPYVPNNHELFSLVGWATSSVFGESEIALRLWSVLPFLVGVAIVTAWLHVRMGALSGLLFLFLATASPLLLDITRMARGYGLAFLAMGVMVVAALEFERTRQGLALGAFVAAGLVGSLTLPHFVIAFGATAVSLLVDPRIRRSAAIWTGVALAPIVAWYAPHLDDIAVSTLGEYGQRIETRWLLVAPVDQTLVPAVTLLDDAFVRPSLASVLWAAAFAVLIASSPLLLSRMPALVLCTPVVATVAAFWVTGTYVVPRFLSFLLVPLFVLVASGSASLLQRLLTRPAPVRTVVAIATFGVIAFASTPFLVDVPRIPRDSTSRAAMTITSLVPAATPVFAHVPYPLDLEHFLGRPVNRAWSSAQAAEVCASRQLAVYVDQPFLVPEVDVPCTSRDGVRHYRFEQYARGNEIDVWVIPPAES